MAVEFELTLHERNDEILTFDLTEGEGEAQSPLDFTTLVNPVVEMYLKATASRSDDPGTEPTTVKLTSEDSAQIQIVDPATGKIKVFVAATYLQNPGKRFYHLDIVADGKRRTAMYGKVVVVNL